MLIYSCHFDSETKARALTCERDHLCQAQEDLLVLHVVKKRRITKYTDTNWIGYDDAVNAKSKTNCRVLQRKSTKIELMKYARTSNRGKRLDKVQNRTDTKIRMEKVKKGRNKIKYNLRWFGVRETRANKVSFKKHISHRALCFALLYVKLNFCKHFCFRFRCRFCCCIYELPLTMRLSSFQIGLHTRIRIMFVGISIPTAARTNAHTISNGMHPKLGIPLISGYEYRVNVDVGCWYGHMHSSCYPDFLLSSLGCLIVQLNSYKNVKQVIEGKVADSFGLK